MSISAPATVDRRPAALLPYLDIVLVALAVAPALAAGAPPLGFTVGAAAWILMRCISFVVDRRLANVGDLYRRLALGVAFSMLRVWLLACAIFTAGLAASRADGLTAALVIFGAFSLAFVVSALVHVTQAGRRTR